MQDHIQASTLREARSLIDNLRNGAEVEASSERLIELISDLIETRSAPIEEPRTFQKPLG